ncbi:hypothetical protein [Pseudozobellia thermophila]|uniref:Uncharacterized protein n=1 Tax=Pseudozobellia thermophila TaxID=192903 RepID=A0A1M6B7B8_9FLAO|nr:hypothetical protein [Pseudozobellia thermophila]SHI44631.1 hypothetical protein SAMN04488513_101313 [Pseudozobellia thermophila]
MKSKLLGIAASLTRNRKYTLALVGAQFAYLGYKYIKQGKRKKEKN